MSFFKNNTEELKELLNCSICYSLFQNPQVTKCGHIFCDRCLFESNMYNSNCSLCKNHTSLCDSSKLLVFDNLKKHVIEICSETEKNELKNHESSRKDWLQQRYIKNFEIGQKIEVLELPDIWNPATVLEKIVSKNGKLLVKIHFDGWPDNYDEIILTNSRRLVPKDFALSNHGLIIRYQTLSTRWKSLF